MTLRDHITAVLDRWKLVLVLGAVCAVIGALVVMRQPAPYQSSALLVIGPRVTTTSTPSSTTQALQDTSIRSTLAQIAMSPATVSSAVTTAKAQNVSPSVKAIIVNDSNVIEVRGSASEGEPARLLTAAAAQRAILTFEGVYPLFTVSQVSAASSPARDTTSPILGVMLGLVVGLFLGYLLALAAAAARRSGFGSPRPSPVE